jgi:hypothetical protein
LAAFAAYQTVLWMLADDGMHGTENGDMLCVGLRRPRIGFVLDVQGREIDALIAKFLQFLERAWPTACVGP